VLPVAGRQLPVCEAVRADRSDSRKEQRRLSSSGNWKLRTGNRDLCRGLDTMRWERLFGRSLSVMRCIMGEHIVVMENAGYTYRSLYGENRDVKALSGINTRFEKGQFIVILGRNGSGKSTFARLINALLIPEAGCVYVKGLRTDDEKNIWEIRRSAGMVFQNPDNQIVGTIVEEDVAFGPENLGVEPENIRKCVYDSLEAVGMREYGSHAPHLLSGGQKQRVAIAGILAMKPECIILDEATAMLDPEGRREVIKVLKKLNRDEGITIIHITHHMDEAGAADRVIVLDEGNIVLDGKPRDVFKNVARIKELGLDVPQVTELFYELNKEGYDLPPDILDVDEAYEHIAKIMGAHLP
jgi:energy-coupling factor transport system ATP-binding protein